MPVVRIMNWGHRRALAPLEAMRAALAARHPEISLEIAERPLSDFEHQGIEGVARAHDLVVFDHPFCGTIAQTGCFLSLDDKLPALLGEAADALYVGPSLATYRYQGKVWGAPIDAASQHAVYRADLIAAAGRKVPGNWSEVMELGEALAAAGRYLGLAVETPHGLATLASLMANQGCPWTVSTNGSVTIERPGLASAYEQLARLIALCPPEALHWNSIDLHEQMVKRDDVAYCPAVYGYATYGEADMRRRLSFADFPGVVAPFAQGTMIGGTALGLSRFCGDEAACLKVLALALEAPTQVEIFARHHGQPARIEAWGEAAIDRLFNGYFSGVRQTLDSVWTRPRSPGYLHFQAAAGRLVADALAGRLGREDALDRIVSLGAAVGD